MYISMGHMIGLPIPDFFSPNTNPTGYVVILFFLSVIFLLWGLDILKSGIKNFIHKTPNMDTLVTIGVLASFLYSVYGMILIVHAHHEYLHSLYFESVAMVLFFIKLGRFIDQKSKEKTSEAISSLVQITPSYALLKTTDGEKKITIDEVNVDDILICKPGMKVAVDGVIIEGVSHLDKSFLTGESMPLKKNVGENVIAGSLNLDGYILYKALKIGKDSMISEVVRIVSESVNTKAPIARVADHVSSYFVPVMIVIAILTLFVYLFLGNAFSMALMHFVNVLVVACPCALGLATPLAIVIGEGVCAKKGILVKTSETLENAHKIDTVVFDKTGTLTYGRVKISNIKIFTEMSEMEVLGYAASLEDKSTHPLREAFLSYLKEKHYSLLPVSDFESIDGMGIKGVINGQAILLGNAKLLKKYKIENRYDEEEMQLKREGDSIVYVVKGKEIIALIGIKDVVRKEATKLIRDLKKRGIDIYMLTGDNYETAKKVGEEVGISHIKADMLPKDKNDFLKELLKQDKKVMMIGDGINDAPALAISTIGVSVSSGTDIANNSASVILMNDNLVHINQLLDISKSVIQNIKQNLFWAFFYNILMIPVAIGLFEGLGITLNPMIASLAMTLSSLTVVFNALRLKKLEK